MTTVENEAPKTTLDPRRRFNLRDVLIGMVILSAVLSVIPIARHARQASERAACANNLRYVMLALLTYESTQGCFPPVATHDPNDVPLYSWRFHTVDYWEMLCFWFMDTDKPWYSPVNFSVANIDYPSHKCPCETIAKNRSYYAVVRDDFMWRETDTALTSDVTDGPRNTIMLVECHGIDRNWAAPGDLTFDDFMKRFRARDLSGHVGGFEAAMVDGSVRFISYDTNPAELEAMFTIAAGD